MYSKFCLPVLYDACTLHQLNLGCDTAICHKLNWAIRHMEQSSCVHILTSLEWDHTDAEILLHSDACPAGMAFWIPTSSSGFQCPLPPNHTTPIFWSEALAVITAFEHATQLHSPSCV